MVSSCGLHYKSAMKSMLTQVKFDLTIAIMITTIHKIPFVSKQISTAHSAFLFFFRRRLTMLTVSVSFFRTSLICTTRYRFKFFTSDVKNETPTVRQLLLVQQHQNRNVVSYCHMHMHHHNV